MRTLAIAITLALTALTFNTNAQTPTAAPSPGSGGGPGGSGHERPAHRPPPSPEEMAARMMEKFDANKDGELSQDELTRALEDLRQHRPHGPGGDWRRGGPHHGAGDGSPSPGQGSTSQASPNPGQGGPEAGQNGPPPSGERPAAPPPDKVAAEMIAKFSSDKKGLKQSELAKALEERRAHRGEHRRRDPQQGGEQPGG